MGYTGQLALGAAGFMAAGAFACFNLILRVPGIPFVGALLISGLSTTGIFSGLTLYAVQTKVDYTIYGNIGIILLFGLLFFGFLISFLQIQMMQTIYSVGGASLFSFYIVYDTQLITGGSERKIQYTIDDFAIASVNLYLDIVNLFLFMLDILGGRT